MDKSWLNEQVPAQEASDIVTLENLSNSVNQQSVLIKEQLSLIKTGCTAEASKLEKLSNSINEQSFLFKEQLSLLRQEEIDSARAATSQLGDIVTALSTVPEGSYMLTAISGIVGGLVASGVAMLLHSFYFSRLNNKNRAAHYSNIAIKLLDDFKKNSLDYWLTPNSSLVESDRLQVHMKTEFIALSSTVSKLSGSLSKKDQRVVPGKLDDLTSQLFDVSMGGDFESLVRQPDKSVAMKVAKLCNELKVLLLEYCQKLD